MPEERIVPCGLEPSPIVIIPARQCKTIHFIRHGQGYHNVAGAKEYSNYRKEEFFDSHLTHEGWRQADELRAHIQACDLKVDLVVASSLTRALETAVGAFSVPQPPHSQDVPLMLPQTEVEGQRVGRPAMSSSRDDGVPPFLVSELCREHLGVNPCDRRRLLSDMRTKFPGADWSLITTEEDCLWLPDHRETADELAARARIFLDMIMKRPERTIAVVTHSEFLLYMFKTFGEELGEYVQDNLRKWYNNCEMRSVVLADVRNLSPSDTLHHLGGAPPPKA